MSSTARARRYAKDVIERQVPQLVRLIDDLLDVSRITRGKIQLREEAHATRASVLAQAIETVRPLINERKHELITSSAAEVALLVDADPTRLEQIVVNLLTNAAKYTESGGRIWLTAASEEANVVIKVRDNGIGIPPEKLPEMFELFSPGRTLARSLGRGPGHRAYHRRKLDRDARRARDRRGARGPTRGANSSFGCPRPRNPDRAAGGRVRPRRRAKGSRILVVDDNVGHGRGDGPPA